MKPSIGLTTFLDAAKEQFAYHSSDAALYCTSVLQSISNNNKQLQPAIVKACDALVNLKKGSATGLLELFQNCYKELHWRNAGFGKLPYELGNKIAVAEIVGPSGLFSANDFRFGALIQSQHIHYPSHSHAAEELYLTLYGKTLWRIGDQESTVGPGHFMHHLPYQTHAMTTGSEPLLALWIWTGDVAGASYAMS